MWRFFLFFALRIVTVGRELGAAGLRPPGTEHKKNYTETILNLFMDVTQQQIQIAAYQPHPRNYNQHSEEQIRRLAHSLKTFGQVRSVVVWRGYFLAGHGVALAATVLGWATLRADVLPAAYSEDLALAYLAADNELARQSDPDYVQLAQILTEAQQSDPDLLLAMGYSDDQFDQLLAILAEEQRAEDLAAKAAALAGGTDQAPGIERAAELRARWQPETGQIWAIGDHRLLCGDGTDAALVGRLLGRERPTALMLDPPYGMALDASYSNSVDNPKKGAKKSKGYAAVIGDDQPYDPAPLLAMFDDVAEAFWWGADYYRARLPAGGSWLVWDKRASVESVEYSSSEFELCWSRQAHQRRILRVPWFGIIGTEQQDTRERIHPTQKPLGVYIPLIQQWGGGLIYDGYLGSGSAMVAAHGQGVRCYGAELSLDYCAIILQRMADAFPGIEIGPAA